MFPLYRQPKVPFVIWPTANNQKSLKSWWSRSFIWPTSGSSIAIFPCARIRREWILFPQSHLLKSATSDFQRLSKKCTAALRFHAQDHRSGLETRHGVRCSGKAANLLSFAGQHSPPDASCFSKICTGNRDAARERNPKMV